MTNRESVELSIGITSAISKYLKEGTYTEVLTTVNEHIASVNELKCKPKRMRDRVMSHERGRENQ
jgi:hypothetical protein